jgi:molybdopterin biosynthesis enzyme
LESRLLKRSTGVLSTSFRHAGDRPTYHPSRIDESGLVTPLDWAGSADMKAVMSSDGFALFPQGDRLHEAGEPVEFLHVDW